MSERKRNPYPDVSSTSTVIPRPLADLLSLLRIRLVPEGGAEFFFLGI